MAIVKELKNLGKKMTGVDISGNIISETLKAIEKNCAGGSAAETIVLDETLGEGAKLSDSLYEYKVPLDAIPDVPHEGVYLSVNGTQYPLTYHEDEEYAYSAVYNMDPQSAEPTGDPWFIVAIKEEVGTGNDVLPGLLGGTENTAYILYVTTGEPIDNATVKLISKAAAPAPSGGDNEVVIDGEVSFTTGIYDASITVDSGAYATASAAMADGKSVRLHAVNEEAGFVLDLYSAITISGAEFISFLGEAFDGEGNVRVVATMSNASTTVELDVYPETDPTIKKTYSFGFTVTPGQSEGELVVTPDSGSTYAAIAAALAETPNVYAVLDLGFQNQVIRALFSVDSTASGAESTSAIGIFWNGDKWLGARLMVSASGADIIVRDT